MEEWNRAVDWNDDDVEFEIERDVMVSAYSIRKLFEARKRADSTLNHRLSVRTYPLIDRIPDLMNWHRLNEFYDLDHHEAEELDLRMTCNQLIHSFVFTTESIAQSEGEVDDYSKLGLSGLYVASDRARSSKLYRIEVVSLIEMIRLVGYEEVVTSNMHRDPSGQWIVSNLTASDMDAIEPGWRDFDPETLLSE